MKDTVRLNFEFPKPEYPYLKLICAEKGISFSEFATELLMNTIEEYEDKKLAGKGRKRVKNMNFDENTPFEKAAEEAGWKKRD